MEDICVIRFVLPILAERKGDRPRQGMFLDGNADYSSPGTAPVIRCVSLSDRNNIAPKPNACLDLWKVI
jgi:hypothetical protein